MISLAAQIRLGAALSGRTVSFRVVGSCSGGGWRVEGFLKGD
jgi:hypothetical protein